MSDIKTLQIKRKAVTGKVSRILKAADAALANTKKVNDFLARYPDLSGLDEEFEKVQLKIEVMASTVENYDLDAEETIREEFEDMIFTIKDNFRTLSPQVKTDLTMKSEPVTPRVKLPELTLSTFSGSYSDWCGFSDLFKSLIHTNSSLSNTEKFQYLKNSLKDDALDLIKNIPVNNTNYTVAWDILEAKYENKRLIVTHYIESILNIPNVTTPNLKQLQKLVSVLNENVSALRMLRVPVDSWNDLLVVLISRKLDRSTRSRWEQSLHGTEFPQFDNLFKFLEKQTLVLETMADVRPSGVDPRSSTKPSRITTLVSSNKCTNCLFCKESHFLFQCPEFRKCSTSQRFDFVKKHNLCLNCLRPNHRMDSCPSTTSCRACNKKHHSLLHFESSNRKPMEAKQTMAPSQTADECDSKSVHSVVKSTTLYTDNTSSNTIVVLPTAILEAFDSSGKPCIVRAIIDSASQANYISESCIRRLNLSRSPNRTHVHGLGNVPIMATKGMTNITLKPTDRATPTYSISALIVPNLSSDMPVCNFPIENWTHLENIKLADPDFNKPQPVDILIGASLFSTIVQTGIIHGTNGMPTALNTVFGWILMGEAQHSRMTTLYTFHLTNSESSLENQLKKFWELEEVDFDRKIMSPDDVKCEDIFSKEHFRTKSGRYSVPLPFRIPNPNLGNSYKNAYHCQQSLNRRLASNPQLRLEYSAFLKDYLDAGHMKLISQPDLNIGYFIPHHCVFKPDSSTTKLRVVFNASRQTGLGVSLNDQLLSGQPLQQDLVSILLRFRFWPIVITADIKQMYRQILVHEEHRPYQRILWNFDIDKAPQVYQLNTVTYGLNCAPFLALRTLKQLAVDEQHNFPNASLTLDSDFYVDDLVTGANSVEEALMLQRELIGLCKSGGFELRKWSSNHQKLLDALPPEHVAEGAYLQLDRDPVLKVLGLYWNPSTDCFSYNRKDLSSVCTKRSILSDISRIFDPLGWLTPVTFFAKHILQALWMLSLDWDEAPPLELKNRWMIFRGQLPALSKLSIARPILLNKARVDLLGFCDASEAGFAAVIYLRVFRNDAVTVHLVTAKSRVAPLKRVSIPRLELCAALLLARLWRSFLKAIRFEVDSFWAWSDSTVALTWIRCSPHRWKTFVANRTSEIQSIIPGESWHHVCSSDNPADCASRGILPEELSGHSLWWEGPSWIKRPSDCWPQSVLEPDVSADSEKSPKTEIFLTVDDHFDLLDRYSSLLKLQRVTAYLLRFVNRCKSHDSSASISLSVSELENALIVLVKITQAQVFQQDLDYLANNRQCSTRLRKLNPFIDSVGVLRVGGRLRHSSLSEGSKYPILLPSKSNLTLLIIRHYHFLYLHPGPQTLQAILFQKFWILSGRRTIRNELLKCKNCFRCTPQSYTPFMGDLPTHRVSQLKAFQVVGVDYAGPFTISLGRHRGAKVHKAYLCIFVCFATKAVHLEVASNLSTEAFLAAFRRFIARRGRCTHVYSDCGTNFVGAKRKLSELYSLLESNSHNDIFATNLTIEGIEWHLNPPSAPHFGGLWEAGVKSVKTHLLRTIGDQILTFEEFYTICVQIESLLNSRPLCPLSSDPNDFSVLTPGHFLVQEPLISLPEPDLSETPLNRLNRWELIQRVQQDIWKKWHSEYLHTLQQRQKWNSHSNNPSIGTMVLIKDNQSPPIHWRLGRIVEVFPGSDGIARVAKVNTANGVLTRPLVKLCPLPY